MGNVIGPLFGLMNPEDLAMDYLLKLFVEALLATPLDYVLEMEISILARKGLFLEYLKSPNYLMFILVCCAVAEMIMHETGILSVTVKGLTIERTKKYMSSIGNISHFVDNISVLLPYTVVILLMTSLSREAIAQIFT